MTPLWLHQVCSVPPAGAAASQTEKGKKRDKRFKKSCSVQGCPLESFKEVGDRRVPAKLTSMLEHVCLPWRAASVTD